VVVGLLARRRRAKLSCGFSFNETIIHSSSKVFVSYNCWVVPYGAPKARHRASCVFSLFLYSEKAKFFPNSSRMLQAMGKKEILARRRRARISKSCCSNSALFKLQPNGQ